MTNVDNVWINEFERGIRINSIESARNVNSIYVLEVQVGENNAAICTDQ